MQFCNVEKELLLDRTFNSLSALSAQVSQCIGGFIFASCLFAVTTVDPSIQQILLKPWQVLPVVNVVGIDMLQPYMVQCSPSSSRNDFQCLRVLLRTCLLLFALSMSTGNAHIDGPIHSNPMGNMLLTLTSLQPYRKRQLSSNHHHNSSKAGSAKSSPNPSKRSWQPPMPNTAPALGNFGSSSPACSRNAGPASATYQKMNGGKG